MISLAHSGDYSGVSEWDAEWSEGRPRCIGNHCTGNNGKGREGKDVVYYLENVPTKQFEVTSEKITEKKHFNVTKKIVQLVKSNRVCKIM